MKILIITHARAGGVNLIMKLKDHLNIKHIGEPWNYTLERDRSTKILDENKLILRTLADQYPQGEKIESFYKTLISKFSLVILLARKNKQEVYESFQHFLNFQGKKDWHTKWKKEDNLVITPFVTQHIDNQYYYINQIHQTYNIPITWYKDLYSGNFEIFKKTVNDWGINPNEIFPYFNPINRLRYE